MSCSCEKQCKTRDELKAAHGTPWEFAAACRRASNDLFVTDAEADAAIARYAATWNAAEPVKSPALMVLEVINVGMLGHAIEVRLPNGEEAYLTIPESQQAKVRAALRAAVDSD